MVIYCKAATAAERRKQDWTQCCTTDSMGSSVWHCVSTDLLCEARNVVSCISINSAWAVKPFQRFVSPTVIPWNATESRSLLWTQQERIFTHILSVLASVWIKTLKIWEMMMGISLRSDIWRFTTTFTTICMYKLLNSPVLVCTEYCF